MKITGGRFRNRKIKFIKNNEIRPVSNKVVEAIFNILASQQFLLENARILDICSGTGVFSLECASRGATCFTLIDNSAKHLALAKENFQNCGIVENLHLIKANAENLPQNTEKPADLIFIDPPYGKSLTQPILNSLSNSNWFHENSLIIVKQGSKEPEIENLSEYFQQIKCKIYGVTKILIYSLNQTNLDI